MITLLAFVFLFLLSFATTYLLTKLMIPRLRKANICGMDMNKPEKPDIPEMGGIAIVAGLTAGILAAVFLQSFNTFPFNLLYILAALITIHSLAFIGIVDDLLDIPQYVKAFLPLFAAIPLVAMAAAASTEMTIPFIGTVDFGIFYIVILVPVGVAVAANLTNMLAGFNGIESGMGIVIFATMILIAAINGNIEMLILFVPMLAALLAFFIFNKYPARIFPGDVGTLTIGAVLAAGVIIGNMESAGALLLLPYVFDFFIKLINRFPSSKWWGDYKAGKLYPMDGKVRGFAQLVMALFNGISEKNLVLFFISLEILIALFVLWLYIRL